MEDEQIERETKKGEDASSSNIQNIKEKSIFFDNEDMKGKGRYYEIINENSKTAKIVFGDSNAVSLKANESRKLKFEMNKYEEIILIFDFNNLTEILNIQHLEEIIRKFLNIKKDAPNTSLSLIIQNCLIEDKEYEPLLKEQNKIELNKLEISDELYSFTINLKTLFGKFRANELVLKKFKFNSKSQILDLYDFISEIRCTKLTLDDFFIELIIKKNENDDEYNDLDIYFALIENNITFNNSYTDINSLTLRDCPLFAIIGDIFDKSNYDKKLKKYIDIDQNSLLNPSIITKFKLDGDKLNICFDLDSLKINLEENDEAKNYDYIDYLYNIFNIISPNWNKKKKDEKEKPFKEIKDMGAKGIHSDCFHKLVFKNFDITKYEYITGEDVTYIEPKNWVLNEEEKKRKERFELFEKELKETRFSNLPKIKELVFDNCSQFFISWVLDIVKGKSQMRGEGFDFQLLKLKKCGKDYVDLSKILQMKIDKLILFDTPLIIGSFPEKGEEHLGYYKKKKIPLGKVDNLTIKLNALDCYGREYNLNVMKTYEILVELMETEEFNNHLTFEMNALSSIMTYLCYKQYVKNQKLYNNQNDEEKGKDDVDEKAPKGEGLYNIFQEDVNYLPKYIFISSKNYRDYLCSNSFKLKWKLTNPITIKNTTIRKSYENYENQNYLTLKIQEKKNQKAENKIYTTNKELRKMDFGSDGFYIERDYKLFFCENNIEEVKLENVAFSNFKDNSLEGKNNRDFETINNLIGINKFGDSLDKYKNMKYPKYIMDFKTFNGIFCVNYGHENITGIFKHYAYKAEKDEEKPQMAADKDCITQTFKKLKSNIPRLCVILNSIKEQKEFYCLSVYLDFLISGRYINESKSKDLPDKRLLMDKLSTYFTQEKNENDEKVYSDFNYYNTTEGEEVMVKQKFVEIDGKETNYKIYIDIKFNSFEEYI